MPSKKKDAGPGPEDQVIVEAHWPDAPDVDAADEAPTDTADADETEENP
jgi:hypothetical protein